MDIKVLNRRVCGDDNATDFFVERPLKRSEIENLAKELQGQISAFGALFYIDLLTGRVTSSTNSLRCTFRTKSESTEIKERINSYLRNLEI